MFINYILKIISNVILIISLIKLIAAFGISEIKRRLYYVFAIISAAFFSAGIFWLYENNLKMLPLIIYPLMIIISFKIVFGEICTAQIYVSFAAEFFITLLSSCCSVLLNYFRLLSYSDAELLSLLCMRFLILILAVVLSNMPKVKKIYIISKSIPKHIFILSLVTLICIELIAVFNNYPQSNKLKRMIFSALIVLLTITLIIMIFSLLINVASKNYYTALNSLLEKQVAAQISHYEKLEKLNSDMRAFRHDYINHLSSINALIGEGCYSDAQNYIEKLTESTHRNEAVFYTGNRLADAILTDKNDSCKDFADIEFEGCITDKIGNSDICIILSNALDNAAEACKKCPERGKISVAAHIRQGYWIMTIRNPTVSADSEGIMKTSKEDERNHGFGLLSIDRAVKKYDGTMAVSIKNGVFEMTVVLKIPVEI